MIGVLPATPNDADLAKWFGVKYPSLLEIKWLFPSLWDIGLLDLLSSAIEKSVGKNKCKQIKYTLVIENF